MVRLEVSECLELQDPRDVDSQLLQERARKHQRHMLWPIDVTVEESEKTFKAEVGRAMDEPFY